MTTTTDRRPTEAEDWAPVDEAYADNSPARSEHRKAVLLAIIACAAEHDGKVHASWLRPLIPAWVDEHMRGNVMSHLSRAGILGKTGRYLPSDDAANRNASRDLPVRYVMDWDRLRGELA